MYGEYYKQNVKSIAKRIFHIVLSCINKWLMNIWHPKSSNNHKYYVAVCAIFKNEAPYFKEWLEFHRLVGVEHFYLYNNLSDDNYQEVLKPYIESGLITLIDWPHPQAQMEAYRDCLQKFQHEMQWLGFIDLDEFVVPKAKNDIRDILAQFTSNRASVLLYWRLFGTSGNIKRGSKNLVSEDFIVCWPKLYSTGKCFLNMNYDFMTANSKKYMLHHYAVGYYKGLRCHPVNIFDNVCFNDYNKLDSEEIPMQINHYFTKSYSEYAAKKNKGDVYFKINPHDEEYFYAHEMKCTAADYSAYKYLIQLKLALFDNK